MSDRFTSEEWELIAALPGKALTAAAVADGVAVLSTGRELEEGRAAIAEGAETYPKNAVIAAILNDLATAAAETEATAPTGSEEPVPGDPAVTGMPDSLIDPALEATPEVASEIEFSAAPGDVILALEAPEVDPRDPEAFVRDVLARAAQAREILDAKVTPGEVTEYVAWIMAAVNRVINRSKTGGFLGIGGERVDEAEEHFRTGLARALGSA